MPYGGHWGAPSVMAAFAGFVHDRESTANDERNDDNDVTYSIDAICVGALWCGDRTLPSVMPTKNIAASIKAITPSCRGGVSLRICLSKSS